MQTFRDVIDAQAAAQPAAPFVFAPEPRIELDYANLRDRARGLSGLLRAQGLPAGAVVAFMLGNGVAAVTVFLGAMYGGYIVTPINLLAQDAQLVGQREAGEHGRHPITRSARNSSDGGMVTPIALAVTRAFWR